MLELRAVTPRDDRGHNQFGEPRQQGRCLWIDRLLAFGKGAVEIIGDELFHAWAAIRSLSQVRTIAERGNLIEPMRSLQLRKLPIRRLRLLRRW
jgi:hypothetical protein